MVVRKNDNSFENQRQIPKNKVKQLEKEKKEEEEESEEEGTEEEVILWRKSR